MGFIEEIEKIDEKLDLTKEVIDAALERMELIEKTVLKDKPLFDSMVKQVARLMLDIAELQATTGAHDHMLKIVSDATLNLKHAVESKK